MDCNKCNCKDVGVGTPHCDDLHKLAKDNVEFGAKVINDTEVCSLPQQIANLFRKTHCVLDNIINNLCSLMKRADCLETKQVHACENIRCEDSRINLVKALITNTNNMYARDNANLKKEIEAYNKTVSDNKALRDKERERFLKEKAQYEKDLATAQASTKINGYASQVISQKLSFKDEGNTFISASKPATPISEWNKYNNNLFAPPSDKNYILRLNESLEVTYGLNNSYFEGTKLAKAVFTFTPTTHTVNGSPYQVLSLGESPNFTMNWNGMASGEKGRAEIKVKIAFYDSAGKHVSVNGGYVAFNSLNSRGDTIGEWEGIKDFKGEYVYITGSSVKNNGGLAYSKTDNAYFTLGYEWDGKDNPKFYYGGIIGKVTGDDIEYTNVLNNTPWMWFVIDTDIAAKVVPKEPIPPRIINDPPYPEGRLKDPIPELSECLNDLLPCDYCLGDKKIR